MAPTLISPVLVGREPELSVLLAALERAAAGDGAVVIVGGEAGVGKTRLVEEAGMRAARRLSGACVEVGGDVLPLAPLVDALRSLARSTPPGELQALLGSARGPLARLVPELDPGEAGVHEGAPAQLLDPLLALLARLSAQEPLMLVFEDLHWADRATLDLVALLSRSLRGMRVALVVTYRSDELHRAHPLRPLVAGWERDRSMQRIALARFTRAEVAGQLEAIVGAAPEPQLVDLVFERSEGNAFLAEEVLDALRSGADPHYLPPSLRAVLLARAERLSEPAQRVLRTVSAAGRWVADGLLSAVATLDEATLYAALREAVEHHLLVVDESGRGYAFRHVLARDAIYDDMLPGERVRLHAAYGAALEADPSLAAGEGAAMLARHWYAAHDLPRALTASVEAAQETAGYAPAEAQRHLERALEIWPQVPDARAAASTRSTSCGWRRSRRSTRTRWSGRSPCCRRRSHRPAPTPCGGRCCSSAGRRRYASTGAPRTASPRCARRPGWSRRSRRARRARSCSEGSRSRSGAAVTWPARAPRARRRWPPRARPAPSSRRATCWRRSA
jgi:predicted ATPase